MSPFWVNAAEMIVGDLPQFTAVSIGWHDEVNDAREDIVQAIERVRGEEGVLLLTDMFGGTPSNLGMTFIEKHHVEVVTGVNLPMLIKLAGLPDQASLLDALTAWDSAARRWASGSAASARLRTSALSSTKDWSRKSLSRSTSGAAWASATSPK